MASADHIVVRACGYNDAVAGAVLVGLIVNHAPSFAILDAEELIRVSVNLTTNFFPWLKRHQNQSHLASANDVAKDGNQSLLAPILACPD